MIKLQVLVQSILALCCSIALSGYAQEYDNNYLIGIGKHDITGSAAEIGMMGYAVPDQLSSGIHNRQFARAYIVVDPNTDTRIVFVNVDAGALFQAVNQGVIKKLEEKFKGLYNTHNVVLSATHTHSAIGGQSHYALYNFTIFGFIKQNYDAHVDGIVAAIEEAHNTLAPGYILFNEGQLENASVNRSLEAYNNNPISERIAYNSNIDKTMQLLKFVQHGQEAGMISWFGVHPTSMKNTNTLLSSDNKGRSQYLFEKQKGSVFTASFAQSNHGDTSPNLKGDGIGPSPTDNMYENTEIIGDRQYLKALELYNLATEQLTGEIVFRHQYNDYSNMTVHPEFTDGQEEKTCEAALGYSFGAGAEDGPGSSAFSEGQLESNPFWQYATNTLTPPTQDDIDCHAPKPILLKQSGFEPYPWSPEVLPTTILKVGQFVILAVPGEFSTMAGRRLRATVSSVLGSDNHYAVAGLSNAYAGYMTTKEEYELQHYEGGSTHFGPWTLAAFQQVFNDLALSITLGSQPGSNVYPRELHDIDQYNFTTGVVFDQAPLFKSIGDIVTDVKTSYDKGDTVKVVFWTGHPRNDLRTQDTFLEVQLKEGNNWITIATDNDWETKYQWKRVDPIWGTSQAKITWAIPSDATSGTYRVRHKGDKKTPGSGKIKSFTAKSSTFTVN